MKSKRLANEIRLLVGRYGFGAVDRELRKLENSECSALKTDGTDSPKQTRVARRRERVKATEYVQKMEMAADKRAVVLAIAERFEAKSFLPRCADITNFCAMYGIAAPASRYRASAIPRLFKNLVAMDTQDVQEILDNNAFGGPSQLGPLAEAIRNHGRASRTPSAV